MSASVVCASPANAKRNFGPHTGYLISTERERETEVKDMVVVQPPPPTGPELHERIFNEKLTKEFRDRYEEKFGRTEVERVYNSPNRYTYYNDAYGFKGTPQEENDERRRYGDFVVRRLLEYHIDNYAQHDPKLRPAWEAKERLKEFKVEVAQFRFDMQYSIAGNTFDVKMNNPWLSLTRVRLQMDPGKFGPAPVDETTLSLGRGVTETIFFESHYAFTDGTLSFIQRKLITPALGGTLTESTFTKPIGKTPRESKYLAGLTYIF